MYLIINTIVQPICPNKKFERKKKNTNVLFTYYLCFDSTGSFA